ncbi:MAG: hypothetical protein PHQ62_01145 [Clostridia bacterium]|nr:hypothetical protein [Clostridia bacterium]
MDKYKKRYAKKKLNQFFLFLAIAFPLLVVVTFLLYYFVPSLVNNQFVVITLVVVLSAFIYFGLDIYLKKKEIKKENQPKKKDPFAD